MDKVIIVMDGQAGGKTKFNEIIKSNTEPVFWTWNINAYNLLSVTTHQVGWNGERDAHYYEWIKKFMDLCIEYWDFERLYIREKIERLLSNDKANVLIIHNCPMELVEELKDDYPNVFNVYISDTEEVNELYDVTLNCNRDDYPNAVLNFMEKTTDTTLEKQKLEKENS